MNTTSLQRSDEPVFWALFGAGGMWSALFSPAVVLVICFLLPLGIIPVELSFERLSAFCQSSTGKIFIALMIVLPLWCGMHRIHHCLHDLKVHSIAAKWLCYSIAGALSAIALFQVASF